MRREFTKAVKVAIIKRATNNGDRVYPWCESCGCIARPFEIDHRNPDAMQIDKTKPLTSADGWLLCIPCHREKTKADVSDIAKAKRVEAAHLGAKPPPSKGFARVSKEKPPLRVASGDQGIWRRVKNG